MAKMLHKTFVAVLLCGAVGLAGQAYAAGKVTHHAAAPVKHSSLHSTAHTGKNLAAIDRKEMQITADLNRAALNGVTTMTAMATPQQTDMMQAAADSDEDYTQQAFLEDSD